MSVPNILFIFTDQQSSLATSVSGNKCLSTPNIDSLARNGTSFQHSYCASPVCSPARASLLTGLLPHKHGVCYNGQSIISYIPTIGEIFQSAGYETIWTGKWHLPEPYPTNCQTIPGFHSLLIPGVNDYKLALNCDDLVADQAIDYLRSAHEKPFLLTVSLHNPHDICYWITSEERLLLDKFNKIGCVTPLPDNFVTDKNEAEFIQLCRERNYYGDENRWTVDWTRKEWETYLNVYYRLTEYVDVQIGRIVDTLHEQGLAENTLVIFTSDHGEGMAGHHWVVKLMLYDEPATVPFIISLPGKIACNRFDSSHLISSVDLLPTLCDYANINPPADLHGISIRPIIDQPQLPGREYLVCELHPDTEKKLFQGRMLRTRQFKYIRFSHGENPEMLFDMTRDTGEMNNLASSPKYFADLARHRQLLSSWISLTDDNFKLSPIQ